MRGDRMKGNDDIPRMAKVLQLDKLMPVFYKMKEERAMKILWAHKECFPLGYELDGAIEVGRCDICGNNHETSIYRIKIREE